MSATTGAVSRIPVLGRFDLDESIRFLEGFTPAARSDAAEETGVLRLAFPVEGTWDHVGVLIRQRAPAVVEAEVFAAEDVVPAVVAQVGRILSLDVDGTGFGGIGASDEVAGRLIGRYPGLRPVLFHSPYEAACWAVIGHRIRIPQAAGIKQRTAERFGRAVPVGGRSLVSFPGPEELLIAGDELGVPEVKIDRLRGLAEAARDGLLDANLLRGMEADEALAHLQTLRGIGPFSAQLILIRGAGHPDVFPRDERRLHAEIEHAYGLKDATPAQLEQIAEGWRPFRSWMALLLRSDRERRTHEISG
ncbi:MAG: DNA-3-methyladenine glycosylase [Amycolatopsis sp.]|jgi:DNA-3-methyladenine glycosylase II|uniref:DNA-3-methyladenine glycosylase family protein n=1 Tax=Amycolatopsis sp. TaxID=37632 RepID=UPI0026263323|nr:DNA-3-methyladenine glycosylase 2 family protein [Amycolatopsis sp.]MCU1685102.1 DNA-3-methyladenine glycosylase [Amycolatopsis sp.]